MFGLFTEARVILASTRALRDQPITLSHRDLTATYINDSLASAALLLFSQSGATQARDGILNEYFLLAATSFVVDAIAWIVASRVVNYKARQQSHARDSRATVNQDRTAGGWEDGRMGGWEDGRMGGWEDGRMGGWEDGRMGGWEPGGKRRAAQAPLKHPPAHLSCCRIRSK